VSGEAASLALRLVLRTYHQKSAGAEYKKKVACPPESLPASTHPLSYRGKPSLAYKTPSIYPQLTASPCHDRSRGTMTPCAPRTSPTLSVPPLSARSGAASYPAAPVCYGNLLPLSVQQTTGSPFFPGHLFLTSCAVPRRDSATQDLRPPRFGPRPSLDRPSARS